MDKFSRCLWKGKILVWNNQWIQYFTSLCDGSYTLTVNHRTLRCATICCKHRKHKTVEFLCRFELAKRVLASILHSDVVLVSTLPKSHLIRTIV